MDEDNYFRAVKRQNRKRLLLYDDEPSTSSVCKSDMKKESSNDYVLTALPSAVKKSKEDSTRLPDPFPLPANFRPDVHICLTNKKMTMSARAAYFSAVASAMFQFSKFPTRDDFVSVARQVLGIYPFLGSKKLGSTFVS